MKIPLSNGTFALIDDEDYEKIAPYKWHADKGRTTYYAVTRYKRKKIYMHRLIMGAEPGQCVDHMSKNGLDNRKPNLRLCSSRQNSFNSSRKSKNRFKGVGWHKAANKWAAHIKVDYKKIHLGLFQNPQDAALEYNRAAIAYFGEFASLNVLEEK